MEQNKGHFFGSFGRVGIMQAGFDSVLNSALYTSQRIE
jgi:hypothetical protein